MASDPQSWTDLKAAVAEWIVRDDQDGRIPQYIAFAERRLARSVFCPERESSTVLQAAPTIALPSDFWGVRSLWLETDPITVLEQMTLSEVRKAYPSACAGRPRNYAVQGGSTLVLGPAPDSDYSMGLVYWRGVPALGVNTATNWLLTAYPDVYLSATLAEAFLAIRDDKAAVFWDTRANAQIEEINMAGRRKQYSGAPFRVRSAVVV